MNARNGRRVAVVATLTEPPGPAGRLPPVPAGVTYLEVRADLAGDPDPGVLRRQFGGRLVYTLRSVRHGGRCADPPPVRHRRLAAAADRYDMIDLEADHDLVAEVLDAVPPHRRRISWHGSTLPLPRLADTFDAMSAVPAAFYLLAPEVAAADEALIPLQLLAQRRRRDLTAYGRGRMGVWSRLLAPWFGAPTVAGLLDTRAPGAGVPAAGSPAAGSPAAGSPAAGVPDTGGGMPSVASLLADYLFPEVPAISQLCGLVGPKAATSGFPRLHNLAYRWYGEPDLPGLFLPFYLPGVGDFLAGFWPGVPAGLSRLGVPLRGLSVSGPLKEAALHVADTAGPAARAAGCANALICRDGQWHAQTTDGAAVVRVLREAGVRLDQRRAVVIGCGGAGRAAALALDANGAEVTLVNRNERRGRLAADLLDLPFTPLASFLPAGPALIVHATPLHEDPPVGLERLAGDAVVLDLVSRPAGAAPETALVSAARRRGLRAIGGGDVMAVEAALQFRLMTGRTIPSVAARADRPGVDTVPVRRG